MNAPSNVLIGHNRWATTGRVNSKNAHPFERETLVGVHNGTLINQALLPDNMDYEVDSENIFHSMEKLGVLPTISLLDGAYALVWWDKVTEKLSMVRNSERTLFFTYSVGRENLYWASEQWMLEGILGRNGVKHEAILSLPVDTVLSWSIPIGYAVSYKGVPKPTSTKTTPYVRKTVDWYGGEQPHYKRYLTAPKKPIAASSPYLGKEVEFEVVNSHGKKAGPSYIEGMDFQGNEVRVYSAANAKMYSELEKWTGIVSGLVAHVNDDDVLIMLTSSITCLEEISKTWGWDNKELSKKDFEKHTINGCSWCLETTSMAEASEIKWLGETEFLCPSCLEVEELQGYNV